MREHKPHSNFRFYNQLITVVLFGCEHDPIGQARSLLSLRTQHFRNIEVIVAGHANSIATQLSYFETFRGISHAPSLDPLELLSNSAHDNLWRGNYLIFARAGTEFDPDCFSLVNEALAQRDERPPQLAVIDHDRPSHKNDAREPIFLPGWDPDLALDLDFIGTAFVASRELVITQRVNDRPTSFHDWLKRVARLHPQPQVVHVSEPILHLTDPTPLPEDRTVIPPTPWISLPRNQWPSMAVVVTNRNRPDLLKRCFSFLAFPNQFTPELVIVDNGSEDPETLAIYSEFERQHGARIVQMNHSFSYSRMVNLGVAASRSDVVMLMHNDVEFSVPGQIEELLRHALRPEVGVVGSRLLYHDGTLQHAGLTFRAEHSGHTLIKSHSTPSNDDGYMFAQRTTRNYQAVSGSVQAIRRDVYESLGGYDELHLPVEYNDVDFCLRARKAGLRVISLPLAGVYHRELESLRSASTASTVKMRDAAMAIMAARWPEALRRDPFINPWIDVADGSLSGFPKLLKPAEAKNDK